MDSIRVDCQDFSLEIEFPEPLDYAGARGLSEDAYPALLTVLDTDEALVRVESVHWIDNGPDNSVYSYRITNDEISVILQWENRSPDPVAIPHNSWDAPKSIINRIPAGMVFNSSDSLTELVIQPGETARFAAEMFLPDDWNNGTITSLDIPLIRKYGEDEIYDPMIHIDLNTPLQNPGDAVTDFEAYTR